jgi:hypothetical protein
LVLYSNPTTVDVETPRLVFSLQPQPTVYLGDELRHVCAEDQDGGILSVRLSPQDRGHYHVFFVDVNAARDALARVRGYPTLTYAGSRFKISVGFSPVGILLAS